ncbi:MAG: leucyl aminopeptidase [Deltaproteobacteria bacterium]|nr:leucyl aminopeptidase [Deltaproteobacteria bacterium]
MKIRVRGGDPTSIAADVMIVAVAAGEEDGREMRALARRAGGAALKRALAATRFRGRSGQATVLPVQGPRRQAVMVVGLGDEARIDAEAWRRAAGQARQLAGTLGATRVVVAGGARAIDTTQLAAFVEGFELAAYRFGKYKSEPDPVPPVAELTFVVADPPAEESLASVWSALEVTLAGVTLARDLVNEPAAVKTPTYIADVAKRAGKDAGLEVEVWDPKRIASEKLAGLIAVARGSSEEPRFVRLRYRAKGAKRRVALVGKGITFDSGGLSLKPAKSMETMKCDMAGAAAVLGTMTALARLKPVVEVEGFIPITENLPGGRAQKPGDVIRYRNDKTVEVLNTDAEGRLVLADALLLAADTKPDAIIDLATLTGACMVALGTQVAGLFANDQALADRLLAVGAETGEPLWQMPLVAEYKDDIKSAVADIKNIGGGHAGSITAALFLQEFVGATPWVHLDIAGPAFIEKALPYAPKGGTGFGVRTLVRYLTSLAAGA